MRYLSYILGMIILALGITLNTKTLLGISPVISVPYSVSRIISSDLGMTVFIYYCLLIFLQFLIYRKKFDVFQVTQVFAALITSLFIDVFDAFLPECSSTASKYLLLAAAIIITGIGAAITVGMNIVPNPADGMAKAVGDLFHRNLGFGKNTLDFSCLAITVIISLVFSGHLIGVGLGTVLTMIFTGRVVALCDRPVHRLYAVVA